MIVEVLWNGRRRGTFATELEARAAIAFLVATKQVSPAQASRLIVRPLNAATLGTVDAAPRLT